MGNGIESRGMGVQGCGGAEGRTGMQHSTAPNLKATGCVPTERD